MNTETRYLVSAFGGQWEDSWETPVIVVKTEDRAKELVKQYEEESVKEDELLSYYKDNPAKLPEHLNDEFMTYGDSSEGEYVCSSECLACKVEDYYPSDDFVSYRYEKVNVEV